MKNLFFILLVASGLVFVSQGNTKLPLSEGLHGLEMQGVVKQTGGDGYSSEYVLDSAFISIYNETKKTTEIQYSDEFGRCKLELPFNNRFLISFSKNGYVGKIICIDTKVAKKHQKHFVFPFDIDLFKKIEGVDISNLLKEPIALVDFNSKKKYFEYNYNYTDWVNGEIRKIYLNYYQSVVRDDFVKQDSTTTSTGTTQPDNLPVQNGAPLLTGNIVYKVQIVAVVYGPLPYNHSVFYRCGIADETYSEGLYKYTIGEFSDSLKAQEKLWELRANGYKDAFIVIFKNGIEVAQEMVQVPMKE